METNVSALTMRQTGLRPADFRVKTIMIHVQVSEWEAEWSEEGVSTR